MPACDRLSSAAAAGSLFGRDVVAIDAHLWDLGSSRTGYSLESVGGVACAWSDADTVDTDTADFQGLVVEVLPHSAAAWDTLASWYPATSMVGASYGEYGSRGANCDDAAKASFCQTNVLVGENWLTVTAKSATPSFTQSTFRATVGQMIPVLDDVLTMPKSTVAVVVPPACASESYEDAVASSFHIPVAAYRVPENIFRIEAAVGQIADLQDCTYMDAADGSGDFVASVAVVPDAAEQLAEFRELLKAQKLAIETVPIGDTSATARSYDRYGTARYELDFELGGSWVTIGTRDTESARAHAAALAGWILASATS
jgi:hypothetical protein